MTKKLLLAATLSMIVSTSAFAGQGNGTANKNSAEPSETFFSMVLCTFTGQCGAATKGQGNGTANGEGG